MKFVVPVVVCGISGVGEEAGDNIDLEPGLERECESEPELELEPDPDTIGE